MQAFKASNTYVELGGVYHDRNLAYFGFGGNEIAEFPHAVFTVEHAVVKVD